MSLTLQEAIRIFSGIVAASVVAVSAGAEPPAAIVEDVKASGIELRFLDYVAVGRIIDLGRDGTLVLGYLQSCQRETITGGRVVIGREQSEVQGGRVVRQRVECDGGQIRLTPEQAGKSTVLVLREAPKTKHPPATVQLRIFGTNPVIKVTNGAKRVTLTRLDRSEKVLAFTPTGELIDLAITGHALEPGGTYEVVAGRKSVVFVVDATAKPGGVPMLGRLIHL